MISIEQEIAKREKLIEEKQTLELKLTDLRTMAEVIKKELASRDWNQIQEELDFLKSIIKTATPVEEPEVEPTQPAVEVPVTKTVEPEIKVEEVKEVLIEEPVKVEEPVVVEPVVEKVEAPKIVETVDKAELKNEAPKVITREIKNSDPFGTTIDRINF